MQRSIVAVGALLLAATFTPARASCNNGSVFSYYAGTGASANDYLATAVGYNAHADCEGGVAVGNNATASGDVGAIAIGQNATASAEYSTSIGANSASAGIASAALGNSARAYGLSSTAIGTGANTYGDYATALGQAAQANGLNTIAIGYFSQAFYDNSIAIGAGTATTAENQVLIGTADYTYTLAGLASASSSAAQTGSNLYMVTSDENGNLAVASIPAGSSTTVVDDLSTGGTTAALSAEQGKVLDGRVTTAQTTADTALTSAWSATVTANNAMTTASGALQRSGGTMTGNLSMGGNRITDVGAPVEASDAANKAYVDQQIGGISNRVANVERQARINTQGVAVAIALGGISLPSGKDGAIGANLGFFQDAQAFAAAGVFRVQDGLYFNSGVGMAIGDASATGGRVGLMAAW